MNSSLKAATWGLAVALYCRFGLEATGWLFYQMSHTLAIDWLYWGYSVFRGAGHFASLWQYQNIACAVLGGVVFLLLIGREKAKNSGVSDR